jgi:hypothetical protein
LTGAGDVVGNSEYLLTAGDLVIVGVVSRLGGMSGVRGFEPGFELPSRSPSIVPLVVGRLSSNDLRLSKVLLRLARREEERFAASRLRGMASSSFGIGGLL